VRAVTPRPGSSEEPASALSAANVGQLADLVAHIAAAAGGRQPGAGETADWRMTGDRRSPVSEDQETRRFARS
jgi:hypothetical protein